MSASQDFNLKAALDSYATVDDSGKPTMNLSAHRAQGLSLIEIGLNLLSNTPESGNAVQEDRFGEHLSMLATRTLALRDKVYEGLEIPEFLRRLAD